MFDMLEENNYFLYINDMLGQDCATSELYIDLTRAKEFNKKDICADVEDKKRREAFAADMKDMFADLMDLGDVDERVSMRDDEIDTACCAYRHGYPGRRHGRAYRAVFVGL
jgi:hypothetical protein